MKYINYKMDAINYLKAYGIEQERGDLLYKRLPSGRYIVSCQSCNDIDVFLCRWVPDSHEKLDESCVINQILSFDNTKEEKAAKFRLMLKQ